MAGRGQQDLDAANLFHYGQHAVNQEEHMDFSLHGRSASQIDFDLNSQGDEFPHLSTYQELLQGRGTQAAVLPSAGRGRGGKSSRGGMSKRASPTGEAASNARAPFRAPTSFRARMRSARGASLSAAAVRASAISTADDDTGTPREPTFTAESDAFEDETQDDEEENLMGDKYDKANWTSDNTLIFCEIYLEEMRAGNTNNGFMTNRGYKSIQVKYFSSTKLRHSVKQLRNRWTQLKGLYQFWLWLNKQTGLGRANGTVVASDDFWKRYTKGKSEWRKLKKGPPEHLEHLEQMFELVAIDGSTSCIPGEHVDGAGVDTEEEGDEAEEDGSPLNNNSRKRPSSTTTTVTSPQKKTQSPMVKIMKGLLENCKADSEATQKVLAESMSRAARERELMANSMKRAQSLVVDCGVTEDSVEYFMAGQLFKEAENREFFCNITTKEGRLMWLKRWCQQKNMY